MANESREKQIPIEFRCRKILPDVEKSTNASPAAIKNIEAVANEGSDNSIASPTPEKSDRKLCTKGQKRNDDSLIGDIPSKNLFPEITSKSTELPEKLKTLADLFDRMCSSIRLLGLRKKSPTFGCISAQVEIMTKRKFSYSHLAQMKYVFPDGIHIEKVLVHNERTLCMEPDLKVNILFDIIERPSYPGQSIYAALCHAFRVRLLEQFISNQEAEIPEADLPLPFNQKNNFEFLNSLPDKSSSEFPLQASVESDSFSRFSHFSSSFRKHFCHKAIVPESERTKALASGSMCSIANDDIGNINANLDSIARKETVTSPPVIKSISEATCIPVTIDLMERTPEKPVDKTAGNEVAETPAMQTPKRPVPTPIEILVRKDEKSVDEPKSTPSVRRTLLYSPQKVESSKSKLDFDNSGQPHVDDHSSNKIMSSKRNICGQGIDQNYNATFGINEAKKNDQPSFKNRQAALDCLPAMFDTICLICQSADCYLITKQELVHKIISNNLDIEDSSQVEEQLGLLEELVPDWFCKKSTCNGEFLYSIKWLPDPNSVRSRLSDAV